MSDKLDYDKEHAQRLADLSIDTMPEAEIKNLKLGASLVLPASRSAAKYKKVIKPVNASKRYKK